MGPLEADPGLTFVHDELLQRLSAGSCLCRAELLIDREIGNALLVTTWTDQDAADRADALLDELPADAEEFLADLYASRRALRHLAELGDAGVDLYELSTHTRSDRTSGRITRRRVAP